MRRAEAVKQLTESLLELTKTCGRLEAERDQFLTERDQALQLVRTFHEQVAAARAQRQ
jgi:hypothetical protein